MKAVFILPGILLALTFCAHAQDIPDDFELEMGSLFRPQTMAELTRGMVAVWSDDDGHPVRIVGGNLDLHQMMGLDQFGDPDEYINTDIENFRQENKVCVYAVRQTRDYQQVERLTRIEGANTYIEMYRVGLECFDNDSGAEAKFQLYSADSGGRMIHGMELALLSKYHPAADGYDAAAWKCVSSRMKVVLARDAREQAAMAEAAKHAPTTPRFIQGYAAALPPYFEAWEGNGKATVGYRIDVRGVPTDITAEKVSFPNQDHDPGGKKRAAVEGSAIAAVSSYRFTPSTKDGVPVPYEAETEITLQFPDPVLRKAYGEAWESWNARKYHDPVLLYYATPMGPRDVHGTVRVSYVVDSTGHAKNITILSSPSPALSKATLKAVSLCGWYPAVNDRQFIAQSITQDIKY
jgi:hypothetical protein